MELEPVLADAYIVSREVGAGRFSRVFQGFARGDGHKVAIKVLSQKLDDELLAESFKRETEALQVLAHPSIVRLEYAGKTPGGFPFLITEFLEEPLVPLGQWDSDQAVELARALLTALERAHADGIIHRDLKPQHVRLDPVARVPKIIDFGIAAIRRLVPSGVTLAQ